MMESNKRFPLKDKACSVGAPILAPQRHMLSIFGALYNSLCCSHWWRQVLEATILFLTSGLYVFSRYNIANVPMWQCNECCRDGGCCQCCTIIRAQAAVNIGARLKLMEDLTGWMVCVVGDGDQPDHTTLSPVCRCHVHWLEIFGQL